MTAEEKAQKVGEIKRRAQLSCLIWLTVFGQILDDTRKLITPRVNIFQVRLLRVVEWCLANKEPVRIVALKPRQVGGTTISAAIIYWFCQVFTCNCVFIADILGRSKKLFVMFVRFAKTDLLDWGNGFKATETDIIFHNGSQGEMKTAENPSGSRADTIQALLASEVAFWPKGGVRDGKKTLTALEGSLAKHPLTIEIIESTGDGPFGVFPERFWDAHWPDFDDYWKRYACTERPGGPDSIFFRVFAAWWEFDKHRNKVDAELNARLSVHLSLREKQGIKLYNWTFEQIAWRRWAIANMCQNDEKQFDAEFPENPEICFQSSGDTRFSIEGINYLEAVARPTVWQEGLLTDCCDDKGRAGENRPSFIPTGKNESWLYILEEPRIGCSYILALDCATDEDMSPKGSHVSDRDRHSPGVLRAAYTDERGNFHRKKLVARIKPPCQDGHQELCRKVHLMSLHYGNCVIAPEMNNTGLSVANILRARRANLIFHQVTDPQTQKTRQVYGWVTDENSRKEILEKLADAIRSVPMPEDPEDVAAMTAWRNGLEVYETHAVNELRSFMKGRKKAEAAHGSHDDDVLMLAIGNFLIASATKFRPPTVRREVRGYSGSSAKRHSTMPSR